MHQTKIEVSDGKVIITVEVEMIKHYAEIHEDFDTGEIELPFVKVDDIALFSSEVSNELSNEQEDGSTLVSKMLDRAIMNAIENGCEGVDHEFEPNVSD